ncbi:hypothetical protein AKO1_013678 [Acrasis kona]|uniref:CBF1-interacting co-repressor CIR N-terminal domain-containing protein n=1 Tax=Acrasis kona TaxID=1008807 RepID=A0AAW2YLJ6_9EUKA
MALAFLNLKGFHPSNKANQRRLFIAEEREKDRIKRDADAIKEWEAEQELFQNKEHITENNVNQSMESAERLKARKQQLQNQNNFVPIKHEEGESTDAPEKKKKRRRRGGHSQSQQNPKEVKVDHPMSLVNVTEFAEKAREEQIKKELAETNRSAAGRRTDKALNFMYSIPPGLKAAMEKEKEEEEKQRMHERFAMERQKELQDQLQQVPAQLDQSFYPKPLTFDTSVQPLAAVDPESRSKPKHLIPDAEKFPILKNAPVAGRYTENVKLKHKPFGIELRDVRCTRCGGFGHNNLDRECPMRNYNPLDIKRQQMEDPMANIPQHENTQPNATTDKEKEAYNLLSELTPKERKKLMKKYKELKRKLNKSHESDSDESTSSQDEKKRRRKHKKRRHEDEEEEDKRSRRRYEEDEDRRSSKKRDGEDERDVKSRDRTGSDEESRRHSKRRRFEDDDRDHRKYEDYHRRHYEDGRERYDDDYERRRDRRDRREDDYERRSRRDDRY